MGSVLAMVAVVTVVAGIATAGVNGVKDFLTPATPKSDTLQSLLDQWRILLSQRRGKLIALKDTEMDLLGQTPKVRADLLKSVKNQTSGSIQSIYEEEVAHFVRQEYPRAKVPTSLTLVQTKNNEYVYRREGDETYLTINSSPVGIIRDGKLLAPQTVSATVARIEQPDGQTFHIDQLTGDRRTLGILYQYGKSTQLVPRAYEFVDVRNEGDRQLLEGLTFGYLVENVVEK